MRVDTRSNYTSNRDKYQIAPCGLECFNCNALEENLTDEDKSGLAE